MSAKVERGFLPCFSQYHHSDYPIEKLYLNSVYVEKTKILITNLIDSINPFVLKNKIGNSVQTIRPTDNESVRLIKEFSFPGNLHRIDYGNMPFRIIFGFSHTNRMAFVLAFDIEHKSYSGKQRKR